MRDLDVIVYGTVCMDLIWRVARLADPGRYEHIHDERRMAGGEAANSAIALARWGLRVALVGTTTGDDTDGRALREMLLTAAPNLDITGIAVSKDVRTPYCVCIATPDGHRTMYGSGFVEMQCPVLAPELAARARIFTMDPNAYQAGIRACRIAVEAGAHVVAMDYTRSPDVNRIAAISVTSHEQVPGPPSEAAFAKYARAVRDIDGCTVIVTCGENGCFIAERGREGEAAEHVPAYAVAEVIDSTGAGDVFRAGLIYGESQGWDIPTIVRFASAAAGLNCGAMGGWGGVRSVAETLDFQRMAQTRPAFANARDVRTGDAP